MSRILEELVIETGLRPDHIRRIAVKAPERYKVYPIKKKNGGIRWIAQPAREVKMLQRALMSVLLVNLPIHDCALAYRKGKSIRDNALTHAGNGPILKMDLKEFFPSIKSRDWTSYCIENEVLNDVDDLFLTERILFFRMPSARLLRLSIGAPSSPMLSNILMREFDELVLTAVVKDRVRYTRYADDLTFSAPRTGHLVNVQSGVAKIIRSLRYPKLDINGDKTTYATRKYHRAVTGLTLANDGRVTLGRERKRQISAMVHAVAQGKVDVAGVHAISGQLAFVNAAEPAFLDVLRRKYGPSIILQIQKTTALD
jgi:RNA-directed DNA polymerase